MQIQINNGNHIHDGEALEVSVDNLIWQQLERYFHPDANLFSARVMSSVTATGPGVAQPGHRPVQLRTYCEALRNAPHDRRANRAPSPRLIRGSLRFQFPLRSGSNFCFAPRIETGISATLPRQRLCNPASRRSPDARRKSHGQIHAGGHRGGQAGLAARRHPVRIRAATAEHEHWPRPQSAGTEWHVWCSTGKWMHWKMQAANQRRYAANACFTPHCRLARCVRGRYFCTAMQKSSRARTGRSWVTRSIFVLAERRSKSFRTPCASS